MSDRRPSYLIDEATHAAFLTVGFRPLVDFKPPVQMRKVPDFAEVKRRYRARQRDYHPDRFHTQPESVRKQAEEMARALNLAYDLLEQKYVEWGALP